MNQQNKYSILKVVQYFLCYLYKQPNNCKNVLQQLAETRQAKTILNIVGSRLEIAESQEDIAKAFEEVSEDLGYKVKVIYTDPSNSPQLISVDKNGNTYIKNGTAYVDKKTGIGCILINTESPSNRTKSGVIGTIAEEQSHVIGKIEGRQKVVSDGSEKGLESLGRPTNDYFKNEFSKNDKVIGLKSDGKDYSNVDFGEHVGDKEIVNIFKATDAKYMTKEEKKNAEKILEKEYGKKYEVDYETGKEVVISANGQIVRDYMNQGTSNNFTYGLNNKPKSDEDKFDKVLHGLVDVGNYISKGTGVTDKTTVLERVNMTILGSLVSSNYDELTKWAGKNNYDAIGYKEYFEYKIYKFKEYFKYKVYKFNIDSYKNSRRNMYK